jgi:hypothetical protein
MKAKLISENLFEEERIEDVYPAFFPYDQSEPQKEITKIEGPEQKELEEIPERPIQQIDKIQYNEPEQQELQKINMREPDEEPQEEIQKIRMREFDDEPQEEIQKIVGEDIEGY